MKKYGIACLSVLCAALLILLASCGSFVQVPDSVIQTTLVEVCEYYDSSADWSWTATHDIDRSGHTDRVTVEMTVGYEYGTVTLKNTSTYQYDRSSDLWTLQRRGEWSEPVYAFNDNLKGDWVIDYFDNTYEIVIKAVNGDKVTLECRIKEEVYGGIFTGDVYCVAEGGGTFALNGGTSVEVPIDLPDEFFVSWSKTASGENEWVTDLNVVLNIAKGVSSAYIYPEISAWND